MKAIFLLLGLGLCNAVAAQVRLPRILRDSMVLQRDAPVSVWGWAAPGEKVRVKLAEKTARATTGPDGKWSLKLPPMKAGGPHTMTIEGKNKITLKEILVGDVWFCSGQSNMVHQLNIHDVLYAKEIANANDADIRQFWVPNITNFTGPQDDLPSGHWQAAVGENVRPFSAVAYFFAKKIHEKYKIPIGIINASWGGTPIEAWISEEGFKDFAAIQQTIQKNKDTAFINSFSRRAPFAPPPVQDKGLTGNIKWFEPSYQPKGWRTISIPGYWEDQGVKDLNGTVWYRREIDIPASMAGKPAKVFLGRIVDADELYINGKKIGNTTYQYPQRRYAVADNVLKAGKNLFVVRVSNTNGKGGFVPDKPYYLFAGRDTIDLTGYWQYKVGEVFIPRSFGGGGGQFPPNQNSPTALYNAMVSPLVQYTIKGFCWYQGESNAGRAHEYTNLQIAQIVDWRNKWRQGELPFLFVQLPGFMDYNYLPAESGWASFREAQLKASSFPNTAMAVAIDLGEWNDIHPDNKKDVGERLALAAKKLAYGENIVYSGPVYKSASIEGNRIMLSFDHTGSGLMTNDGEPLSEFSIAGADKRFVWANAKIEGDKVIVWSDEVPAPAFVRYAWADNPVNPNLFNREGLPATPFRTDK
jgi:sialate O-acetylesterase